MVELNVTLHRPLVSLDFAATVLNITPEAARGLIEDGSILFAWDLSRKQGRKPLVRVWAQSLLEYAERRPVAKSQPTVEAVIDQVFPTHGQTISAHLVSRRWGVDEDHTLNLWRAGLLRKAKGAVCRPGPGGSPALEFASVVEFMEERLLC